MPNRLRRFLAATCAALLLSTCFSASAIAGTRAQADSSNAPAAVDAMILRPVGVVSLVLGTAIFVVVSPVVLITRPQDIGTPFKQLVGRPAKYLWMDPIGGH